MGLSISITYIVNNIRKEGAACNSNGKYQARQSMHDAFLLAIKILRIKKQLGEFYCICKKNFNKSYHILTMLKSRFYIYQLLN